MFSFILGWQTSTWTPPLHFQLNNRRLPVVVPWECGPQGKDCSITTIHRVTRRAWNIDPMKIRPIPIGSMGLIHLPSKLHLCIYIYIYMITYVYVSSFFMVDVGKYTLHTWIPWDMQRYDCFFLLKQRGCWTTSILFVFGTSKKHAWVF